MSKRSYPHISPDHYAATMAAYAQTLSSLLARLDGCLDASSPASGTVKPAPSRQDFDQGERA